MKERDGDKLGLEKQNPVRTEEESSVAEQKDSHTVLEVTKRKPEQIKITSMCQKHKFKLEKEQARKERMEICERKRAELIERVQPWRWLEMEAKKLMLEIAGNTVDLAIERKRARS